MAWTTPLTAVANAALTAAQWNASVRDNLNETGTAKVTASGQILVSTGANALAARSISGSRVGGSDQNTSSTTFTDLITNGPAITATTGTRALVVVTSFIANSTAGAGGYMGYAVSGATTIAALDAYTLRLMSSAADTRNRASALMVQTGLTTGSNTFTAKYKAIPSGTASFDEREMALIPL